MPKGVSKEKNDLISGKGCYPFLLERDDTKKKLRICNQLLTSLLKTRAVPIGIELVFGNHEDFDFGDDYFGAIFCHEKSVVI